MHSATQIIAQRAPPASRTTKAARWQPYLQSSTQLSLRSPSMQPPSHIVPSPAPSASLNLVSSEPNRSRLSATAQTPKELSQGVSSSKQKFANGLIDQAVSTLSDIWRPQDIPSMFLPPVLAGGCSFSSSTHHPLQSKQPSLPVPGAHTTPSATLALLALGNGSDQILPLKTFVHEVLRRSRTSGNVLQTALCYLEAIRVKVPEILQEENMGIRAHYQPESVIQPATPEELEREAELCVLEDAHRDISYLVDKVVDDSTKTIRVTDSGPEDLAEPQNLSFGSDRDSLSSLEVEPSSGSTMSSPSSPSLPSPLLCPRRAFLASLILASKFSQDKCYSNRAWAKLSGLPPREIGRCERALGQALQWRLWVGKRAVGSQPENVAAATPSRPITRSQSEASFSPTSVTSNFLSQDESLASQSIAHSFSSSEKPATSRPKVGIRRCLSLPLEATVPGPSVGISTIQDFSKSETDLKFAYCEQEDQIMGQPMPSDNLTTSSPSPPTPTLTYSPSSTDSSGDRTIQISTLDDNMYMPSSYGASQSWTNADGSSCENTPTSYGTRTCRYDGKDFARRLAMLQPKVDTVSVVESDVATYGTNYLWSADSRYILESTEVH